KWIIYGCNKKLHQILNTQTQFEIRTLIPLFRPPISNVAGVNLSTVNSLLLRTPSGSPLGLKLLNWYQVAETWNFEVNSGYN
ncbi:hypothetical protein MTR67_033153, partial [Solanum verrucosum]